MAALGIFVNKRDTHNSEDRYDGSWLRIYPKSIRFEDYRGVDPNFGYARYSYVYYVGGLRLEALHKFFEVTSNKQLVEIIRSNESIFLPQVTRWIGENCEPKGY